MGEEQRKGFEYIEMALSGERRLTLRMPGLRDKPQFEIPSRPGYLPRTAACPTMLKVGTDIGPDGVEEHRYQAKYHPSGPKFSATIDLIFDSWCDPDNSNYRPRMGVPAGMDYEAQFDAKRDGSDAAFADTKWHQMNKSHFTWMSDHAPLYLHVAMLQAVAS